MSAIHTARLVELMNESRTELEEASARINELAFILRDAAEAVKPDVTMLRSLASAVAAANLNALVALLTAAAARERLRVVAELMSDGGAP